MTERFQFTPIQPAKALATIQHDTDEIVISATEDELREAAASADVQHRGMARLILEIVLLRKRLSGNGDSAL